MSYADSALHELLAAGHLEQVVSQARRVLEREPRRPFWMRFALCLCLIVGLWVLLFKLFRVPLDGGFVFLGSLAVVHSIVLLVETVGRRIRSRFALRQMAKVPPKISA